jgi:hypothetical protein
LSDVPLFDLVRDPTILQGGAEKFSRLSSGSFGRKNESFADDLFEELERRIQQDAGEIFNIDY